MNLRLAASALALVTLACSGPRPVDPDWQQRAGVQVLRLRWVKRLAPALPNFFIPELVEENDRFDPLETGSAGFDTDRRRAFVGAAVGGLYCVDIFRGETVWRFDLQDPVGSTPLYDADRRAVYFGADDGAFYALHARSGRKLWSVETGAEIQRRAILRSGTLYVVNADNTVFALDPDSGEIVWQYRRPPVEGFSSAGHAGLTVSGTNLITGFSDGYLAAIDAVSGTIAWATDLASEVSAASADGSLSLVDVDATPVISRGILVAASVAGGLYGLDPDTGTVRWTRPEITGVTGIAARDGVVYAARSAFGLTAVDASRGAIVWSRKFESGTLQDPVAFDDVLLVSDSEYGLYVVSNGDGKLLQRIDQREGFFARPSVRAGYLLIIGNDGVLYAMSIL